MKKTNEDWRAELTSLDSATKDMAILELHMVLLRGLFAAFKSNECATPVIIEDAAQESLLKIIANLEGFRGESMFITWAMKIAIRTVYSEMRKAGWKDVSLDQAAETSKPQIANLTDGSSSPEKLTMQAEVVERLWNAINESLTEKQKKALLADFVADMPIEEIARKMGTNRNAVYKLLYDARQNLKRHLTSLDITPDEIKKAFDM